ncbi:MAG: YcxB family protein [Lawsonibacter sp.]|nr:YcxB family protein [Lawsonibacter sp.]
MFIIQTEIDQKAMTALAAMTRKVLRRGRNGPVRRFAWCVVIAELVLTVLFLRAGVDGWPVNLLMALIMLACILGEDYVNGVMALRQVLPSGRAVNATFKDDGYVHRTQSGESQWPYRQIQYIVESDDYFALLLDKTHGQIYDKKGFSWGKPEEFREFIQRKTGLKVQKVRYTPVQLKAKTGKGAKKETAEKTGTGDRG